MSWLRRMILTGPRLLFRSTGGLLQAYRIPGVDQGKMQTMRSAVECRRSNGVASRSPAGNGQRHPETCGGATYANWDRFYPSTERHLSTLVRSGIGLSCCNHEPLPCGEQDSRWIAGASTRLTLEGLFGVEEETHAGVMTTTQQTKYRRVRVVDGWTAWSRFLYTCEDAGKITGYIPRVTEIPSPYAGSPTECVFRYRGMNVFAHEVSHKRHEVFEIPTDVQIVKREDDLIPCYSSTDSGDSLDS